MSYDPEDAAREAFYEQISDEAINEFTVERLQSFYFHHDDVMRPAILALNEGTELLKTGHHSASVVFHASAVELFLKATILKPVVYGLVHNDALAELIVKHALSGTGFVRYNRLLSDFFKEIGHLDIKTICRQAASKPLIDECGEIAECRNRVVHEGSAVTEEDAERAREIATATYDLLVRPMLTALGLYTFDDGIVSTSPYRTMMTPQGFRVPTEPLFRTQD